MPPFGEVLQPSSDFIILFTTSVLVICNSMHACSFFLLFRTLTTVCGWIKFSLSSEQKKADFKRDSESGPIELYSPVSVFGLILTTHQGLKKFKQFSNSKCVYIPQCL